MGRLFIDKDWQGLESSFAVDGNGDVEGLILSQDVEGVVDELKRRKADNPTGDWEGKEGRLLGTIPIGVVETWKNTLGVDVYNPDHVAAVKKLLRDPEWSVFRMTNKEF